jgi:Icc-related predicted phosphoesterase
MNKLRVMSDLHLEFGFLDLPKIEGEEDMILVLAGDIGLASKPSTYLDFIVDSCHRHKYVIWLFGNHEYYYTAFDIAMHDVGEAIGNYGLENLFVFQEPTLINLGGIDFVIGTMWADFDMDRSARFYAQSSMNDYRLIDLSHTDPFTKLSASDTQQEFHKTISKFDKFFKEIDFSNPVVVVTHHAPSKKSISECYAGSPLNPAYASDLDNDIEECFKADIWIHGHMHNSNRYTIGNTLVVSNPRGYVGEETNDGFDPNLVIDLGETDEKEY